MIAEMLPVVDAQIDDLLDSWLPDPGVRVAHRRESDASAERLFQAACDVPLAKTRVLGRLIRWRIPGIPAQSTFEELFRGPPFIVLEDEPGELLVSGLVGQIWTMRRDYPQLTDPDEFCEWSKRGTAKVLFSNWVAPGETCTSALHSETRVAWHGTHGRLGVSALRPLIMRFANLIGSEGLTEAVRAAERE